MSGELVPVWKDENSAAYVLNAANLSAMCPHILHLGTPYLNVSSKSNLRLSGNTAFKIVVGGVHKMFTIKNDLEFNPAEFLDTGSVLDAGTDYKVFVVSNASDSADLVVSKNTAYPSGASLETSKCIGGFHTLCVDVGTLQTSTHALYGFLARDILPNSVWDMLRKPATCAPDGMVLDPNLKVWVDIYLQSGTGENTKSVYQGRVTHSQTWDAHQEDLAKVGKRMLRDVEFTSAAWGTIPYKAVLGSVDPVTTGGKTNTDGNRIISDIGCEDMCGCYWQCIGHTSFTAYATTGMAYADADGQGQQYLPSNAMLAGGRWSIAAYSGARARYASNSRADVGAARSSRGAAENISVI